jgi:lipopolysaccharide heptosyltransferase II
VDLDAMPRSPGTEARILVTRLRYLGDVILTTPAVAALKARYPGWEIHYLAERPYASILEGNPDLARVIGVPRGGPAVLGALRDLRRARFSAAIDLFYNPRSALMLYLSGIPVRAGGARRFRRRLYTHLFRVGPATRSAIGHHVEAMGVFDVEPRDSLPRIYLSARELESGRELMDRAGGAAAGRTIAMHPGGTWPSKRWSAESFAALARLARERLGASTVLVTGPGEEGIVERVRALSEGSARPLPVQSLRAVASIIAASGAVVANDGGILHMAVALGRPTVGVFGPTEPDIWFPYEGRGPYALVSRHEECAPCHLHACARLDCLRLIPPGEVLARLEEVLSWRR